ncbi:MAG: NADH-quinone oxidoreductase subunit L [Alphaproteobacteria bacterium ADurb.Bin438]|nr:MAG: NADH-quinone oxidoreductase subunit L [Alphaproteobacteria bacterium ADurb.Bin438]
MANLLIILPLFSALIGFVSNLRKVMSFIMLCSCFVCIVLLYNIDDGYIVINLGKFLNDINYTLKLDEMNLKLSFMVSTVAFLCSLYTIGYVKSEDNQNKLLRLNSIFAFFMIYFICSDNLFNSCISYGMTVVTAFFIISFYDFRTSVNNLAAKVTSFNFIGYIILLVVTAILSNKINSFDFVAIINGLKKDANENIKYIIILCGFIMSGVFGFHNVVVKANKASQASINFLYGSTFIACGLILCSKFHEILKISHTLSTLMMFYCAISSLILAFYACTQFDLKKIVLYSSCSQISLIFLTLPSNNLDFFSTALIYHSFLKLLLFMCIGAIISIMSNERNIFNLGGIFKLAKLSFLITFVAGILTLSFPLIISNIQHLNDFKFLQILLYANTFFTSFYITRLIILVFFKNFRGDETIFAHAKEANGIIISSCIITMAFSLYYIFDVLKFVTLNNISYHLLSFVLGFIFSFKRNYINTPTPKSEEIINEGKLNATLRFIASLLIYRPAVFCFEIIENKIIFNSAKYVTSLSLSVSNKIKKAKESNIFIYNFWIIISTLIIISIMLFKK